MKIVKGFQQPTQPIETRVGTNAEAFVVGEILTLSSGVLTKAGVDSTGTQMYVCLANVTGATGVENVPVVKLRKDLQFEATSSATVAATLKGQAVTLTADATGVTATTTNGVFVIDETDGATTNSKVVGHFKSADAI